MKTLRQVFLGIIIALASLGLILGGFSLSLAEGNITANLVPTHSLTPTYSPTLPPSMPSVVSMTPSPTPTLTLTLSLTPTSTPSLPPPPTNCPPPAGWIPNIVQPGDTLAIIATHYRINITELQQVNCLLTTGLLPGMVIYVPPLPTQTPLPCGRPASWIVYIVKPGDTLYHLSQAYGVSVAELQRANCMGNSTLLHVGQVLYVPPWAMRTPSPTFPSLVTSVPTPTNTPEIILPSDTPTEAITSPPTESPPTAASETPVEVPTDTIDPAGP